MAKNIEHFLFVPGIGAGKAHPAGRLINEGIEKLTKGSVETEIIETCDEIDTILIPHSLE